MAPTRRAWYISVFDEGTPRIVGTSEFLTKQDPVLYDLIFKICTLWIELTLPSRDRRLLSLKPDFAEAHSSLGMTLQKLDGKFKEVEFKNFDYFIPIHFPINWKIRFRIYVNTPSFVARLCF